MSRGLAEAREFRVIECVSVADSEVERSQGGSGGDAPGEAAGDLQAIFAFEQGGYAERLAGADVVGGGPGLGEVQEIFRFARFDLERELLEVNVGESAAEDKAERDDGIESRLLDEAAIADEGVAGDERREMVLPFGGAGEADGAAAESAFGGIEDGGKGGLGDERSEEAVVDDLKVILAIAGSGGMNGYGERDSMGGTADFAGDGGGAVARDGASPILRGGELEGSVQIRDERDDAGMGEGEIGGTGIEETVAECIDFSALDVGDRAVGGDIQVACEQADTDHGTRLY